MPASPSCDDHLRHRFLSADLWPLACVLTLLWAIVALGPTAEAN
jgi:hypothetical protein